MPKKPKSLKSRIRDTQSPDVNIRLEAVKSLESSRSLEAIPAVISALDDPEEAIQNAAEYTLRCCKERLDIFPFLTPLLSHGSSRARHFASSIILFMEDKRAVPYLIDFLEEGDDFAARTLGDIGDRSAIPALIKALRNVKDAAEAFNIWYALGKLGCSDDVMHLSYLLETKDWVITPEDRLKVLEPPAKPLRKLSPVQKEKIEADIALLAGPNDEARSKAICRLGRRKGHVVEYLVKATASPNLEVRFGAIFALGRIRDPRTFPVLLQMTNDPYWDIRWDAYAYIGKIDKERALPILLDNVRTAEENNENLNEVIEGTEAGLGHIGGIAIPYLIEIIQTSAQYPRLVSLWALRRIGDASALDFLSELLFDSDPRIRESTVGAIGSIAEKNPADVKTRCKELISKLINDPDADVRSEVESELGYI